MAAIPSQVPTRIYSSEKAHPSARTTSTQSHPNNSQTQLDGSPKSWQKPGAWGSVRRGWRNVQRYIWDDGYVIGQIPAVILVTKIRPSILVSSLEVLWAVFTFCCAAVTSTSQLYALRFLVGLCEGAFFPCIIYLIGSWCMYYVSTCQDATTDTARYQI
jgi:hypothetical protein